MPTPKTAQATPTKPKTAGDFAAPAARPTPYRFAPSAKKVPCGKGSLVRGVRMARNEKEKEVPTLLYVSGDNVSPASTLAHIGAAIQHGLITPEEIVYLQSLSK